MPETIGVISDTHGLLRPEAVAALEGCGRIIHAGDIGSADVLNQLRRLAPVVAVRGNVDKGHWANALPLSAVVELEGHSIYVIHILGDFDLQAEPGVSAVVFGHSHQPSIEERDGIFFLNPGSAGPRRFNSPVSVARISVVDGRLTPQLIPLSPVTP
jgi:putative phosphoesterase